MLLTASFVVNLAGGAAFVLVGTLLLLLRPARPGAIGFAAFALASGAQRILGNLGVMLADVGLEPVIGPLRIPFMLVAPAAICWAAARYRGPSVWPAYPFFATGLFAAVLLLVAPSRMLSPNGALLPLAEVLITVPEFLGLALSVFLLAQTLRHERSDGLRIELRLLLAATSVPLGYSAAFFLVIDLRDALHPPLVQLALIATFLLCIAAASYSAVVLARGPDRGARFLAFVCVAVTLAGAIQSYLTVSWAQFGGLLRIAAALLLGYSLLKFRVFDIDLKVRSTLAAGIVAGIAVAGFFVASEVAETFVADRTGSTLLGLAVAAGLLILETRVTHASRGLAKRALPHVDDGEAYFAQRRAAVYRTAYESAARDGALTERERGLLGTLARELGLTADDTARVEREVMVRPA